MNQKRVLLIENHPELREALHELLSSTGSDGVDVATDIVDGFCLAVHEQPTFVILDTAIAELNAVTFSGLIHRLAPDSKVILLVDDAHEYGGLAEAHGAICVTKRTVTLDLPLLLRQWCSER